MTFGTFVRQLFNGDFGVEVSDATVLSACLSSGLEEDVEVTGDNYRQVMTAVIGEVPTLLLRPESVGESGFSLSRASREAITEWYNLRCKEYGLDNALKGRIRFL
jgi:hypothetical protein